MIMTPGNCIETLSTFHDSQRESFNVLKTLGQLVKEEG